MKTSSLKKNFIYNVFYQMFIIILPLITIPYVSRVLGSKGIGIYSYTYSIVYYFMLIALLGINNYGNRTVAKVRDDKEKLSKAFSSIYAIQLVMSLLMLFFYVLYILLFDSRYSLISSIQIIYLISCIFDIGWFFFGLEEFKITVTRNTVVKIISLICIFLFVKTSYDLWKYTLILSLSSLLSNALLVPFLLKRVKIVSIKFNDTKKHIKPILVLFIPVIAVSLYKVMDKTMLGIMCKITEVGYYEQAEKIIAVPLALITALGTVMLPRISNLVSKGDTKRIKEYMEKSIKFMMFLAFPICLGIIAVSKTFIPMFLGDSFIKTSTLIYYISITIIFISFANVIRTQYLIPKEKDKIFIVSVVGGAIINLIINSLLIPVYQSIGACIGTVAAELFVMVYQVIKVRKELPIIKYFKSIIGFLYKSILMFIIVFLVGNIHIIAIYKFLIQTITGVIIYGILNYKYIFSLLSKGEIKNVKENYKIV